MTSSSSSRPNVLSFFSSLGSFFKHGESIEKYYKLDQVLGQGSFAKVYKAQNRASGEFVAIKAIDKSGKTNMKMMEAEVEILNNVHHPNCVSIQEIFDTPDHLYLVMDLCTGGELLKALSKRERFSEREASMIIRDILEGLKYLHSQGIVHRDLKPENLLLADNSPDSLIKITDFGLSKLVQGKHQFLFSRCGTPSYVAPELIKGEPYDEKVDLWGVGVICYLIIAGYPPFWGESIEALFDKIIAADFAFHAQYWKHVSPACMHFIEQLLERDPHKRYDAKDALQHTWILNATPKVTSLKSMAGLRSYDQSRHQALDAGTDDQLQVSFSGSSDGPAIDPWRFFTEAIGETRVAAGRSLESSDMIASSSVDQSKSGPPRVFVYDLSFNEALFPRIEAKYPRWPLFASALKEGRLTGTYDVNIITSALSRQSPQKTRAFEAGFIRPFLLLVSMSPYTRLAAALSIGVEGIQEKIWYGNPHLEAWEILSAPKVGLIARSGKFQDKAFADSLGGVCWFDTLFRVSDKIFTHRKDSEDLKEKIADYQNYISTVGRSKIQASCRDPAEASLVEELEVTFLVELFQKMLNFRATIGRGITKIPRVFDTVDQIQKASPAARRMLENFEIAGYDAENPDVVRGILLFANFFFGHRWLRDGVDEGANEMFLEKERQEGFRNFIKQQMGYGWLVSICAMCTLQRLIIGAIGLPLGPFYPSKEKTL